MWIDKLISVSNPNTTHRRSEDIQSADSPDQKRLEAAIEILLCAEPASGNTRRAVEASVILSTPNSQVHRLPLVQQAAFHAVRSRAALYEGLLDNAREEVGIGTLLLATSATGETPAYLARCASVLAETCLGLGDLRQCAKLCLTALDADRYGPEAALELTLHAMLAIAFELSGDHDRACVSLHKTTSLLSRSTNSATNSATIWIEALSGMAIDTTVCTHDVRTPDQESEDSANSSEKTWSAARKLAEARRSFKQHDYRKCLAVVDSLKHMVITTHPPPLVHAEALSLQAFALTQLGNPKEALRVTSDCSSLPGHSVCFELPRATALIQLGRPKEALHVTDQCLEVSDHGLRTFPSIFLRRAVAYEMQGFTSSADDSFSRASHMAYEAGLIRPSLGIRNDILEALLRRLIRNEPDFGREVTRFIPLDGDYEEPLGAATQGIQLTKREMELIPLLDSNLTVPKIAAQLYLSPNTIKTELRHLYKKLGVSSRQELVDQFRNLALDEGTTGDAAN